MNTGTIYWNVGEGNTREEILNKKFSNIEIEMHIRTVGCKDKEQ
jgi:hypothetical protein